MALAHVTHVGTATGLGPRQPGFPGPRAAEQKEIPADSCSASGCWLGPEPASRAPSPPRAQAQCQISLQDASGWAAAPEIPQPLKCPSAGIPALTRSRAGAWPLCALLGCAAALEIWENVSTEKAVQEGSAGGPIPGSVQRERGCGTRGHGFVGIGPKVDPGGLSKHNNSMIP